MISGPIQKMSVTTNNDHVVYKLPMNEDVVTMNDLIGKTLKFTFGGTISCIACQRKIKKSFNQGYCYPCFRSLAQCDICIVKPELCHFDKGTCRQPSWGQENCMIPHTVYLSNSSGLKVGITRSYNLETRWIDQGAIQAIPLVEVARRKDAGSIEVQLKTLVNDKTNWRAMLKGDVAPLDMVTERSRLLKELEDGIPWQAPQNVTASTFHFPVTEYPQKISTFNFDKRDVVEGDLMGIKGQYLILSDGVLNMRKFAGYHVDLQYS